MSYLGSKGYTVLKSSLSEKQQEEIKSELTIKPHVHGSPPNSAQHTFPTYRESHSKIYMPHYYGVAKFGQPSELKIPLGASIHLKFNGDLRETQRETVSAYINHIEKTGGVGGGLIELNCGGGKTVCALNIISHIQKKTIIIVHKEFLMNQWIERIHQF